MSPVEIPDFSQKFAMAVQFATSNGRTTNAHLYQAIGVSHQTWAVWKRGDKKPDAPQQQMIVDSLMPFAELSLKDWMLPIGEFRSLLATDAQPLLSEHLGALVTFNSRDSHPDRLLEQLSGAWVAYYVSTSRTDRRIVSRDLVEIAGVHNNGYIGARVIDSRSEYRGFCFSYHNLIQWFFEKEKIYNEVLSYMTTMPERSPPVLMGVMICISGGVSTVGQLPAAAKVAMVRLGTHETLAAELNLSEDQLAKRLRTRIPRYVEPSDLEKWLQLSIENRISMETLPSALVVNPNIGDIRADETITSLLSELKKPEGSETHI